MLPTRNKLRVTWFYLTEQCWGLPQRSLFSRICRIVRVLNQNMARGKAWPNTVRLIRFPVDFPFRHGERPKRLRPEIDVNIARFLMVMAGIRGMAALQHSWLVQSLALHAPQSCHLFQQRLKPTLALSRPRRGGWGEGPGLGLRAL